VRANTTADTVLIGGFAKALFAYSYSQPMGFYFPRPEHVFVEEF
jgi:hypothetical protein